MQKTLIVLVCAIAVVSSARLAFKLAAGVENFISNIDTSFTCQDKQYGYYADVQNECKIFHVCFPVQSEDGQVKTMDQFSFVCGNQTIFNQESLTCTTVEEAVPCEEATNLYDTINAAFGQLSGRTGSGGQFRQGGSATDNPGQVEDTTPSRLFGK